MCKRRTKFANGQEKATGSQVKLHERAITWCITNIVKSHAWIRDLAEHELWKCFKMFFLLVFANFL